MILKMKAVRPRGYYVKKEFNRCCICFGLVWRRGYAAKKTMISSIKTKYAAKTKSLTLTGKKGNFEVTAKTSQKAKFAITEAGQSENINY